MLSIGISHKQPLSLLGLMSSSVPDHLPEGGVGFSWDWLVSAGSLSGFSAHTPPASVTEKHNARKGPVLTVLGGSLSLC